MADELARLAERRRLLVARASMQRLQATVHVARLREGSRKSLSAAALLATPPARSALLAATTFALGKSPLARAVRVAGLVFLAVRLLRQARGEQRRNPQE